MSAALAVLTLLGELADPIAHLVELALQDSHDDEDERQLLLKAQRAISDARARRKFSDAPPEG